jgi:Rhodopirellula transposase DDE domain
VRLWKLELQKLADETGLEISICHLPPGTSKWNKIEHRLFSFISQNWRGKPLISHQVIVNLIAATTTKGGSRVRAECRSRQISERRQGFRQGGGHDPPGARQVSRRMDLHHTSAFHPDVLFIL